MKEGKITLLNGAEIDFRGVRIGQAELNLYAQYWQAHVNWHRAQDHERLHASSRHEDITIRLPEKPVDPFESDTVLRLVHHLLHDYMYFKITPDETRGKLVFDLSIKKFRTDGKHEVFGLRLMPIRGAARSIKWNSGTGCNSILATPDSMSGDIGNWYLHFEIYFQRMEGLGDIKPPRFVISDEDE
jgi:hypothetical protein